MCRPPDGEWWMKRVRFRFLINVRKSKESTDTSTKGPLQWCYSSLWHWTRTMMSKKVSDSLVYINIAVRPHSLWLGVAIWIHGSVTASPFLHTKLSPSASPSFLPSPIRPSNRQMNSLLAQSCRLHGRAGFGNAVQTTDRGGKKNVIWFNHRFVFPYRPNRSV